ncbi:Glucose-induced degradation protein 4-like protein, partial [Mucuna pruriens]
SRVWAQTGRFYRKNSALKPEYIVQIRYAQPESNAGLFPNKDSPPSNELQNGLVLKAEMRKLLYHKLDRMAVLSTLEAASLFPCASILLAFSGTQNVSSLQKDEAWRVNVRIQGCDLEHGYLCGTMEALNVPMADTPVVTFWEGEIVDTKNYTFFTGKWEATPDDDIRHWTKFPSFSPLLGQVEVDGGKSLDLSNYPYIFMRWKEQYFVNVGTDCGLTIAGFYYVCFSCSDGSISGFYYDPNSSPFQKLELKSTNDGRSVNQEPLGVYAKSSRLSVFYKPPFYVVATY